MEDDEAPRRPRLQPPALDPLGVEELRAYIRDLEGEIARAEAAIRAKQGHRSAAEAFFRKP